jgi:hypothetical protein
LTHASLSRRNVSCSSQFVLEYWPASTIHCPCLMYGVLVLLCFPVDCVLCDALTATHAGCSRPLLLASARHAPRVQSYWLNLVRENMVMSTLIRTPNMIAAPDLIQVYIAKTLDNTRRRSRVKTHPWSSNMALQTIIRSQTPQSSRICGHSSLSQTNKRVMAGRRRDL